MADRGGLLTRASAAFGKFFLKRELVGVDALGNKYYKYEHPYFLLLSMLTYLHTIPGTINTISSAEKVPKFSKYRYT